MIIHNLELKHNYIYYTEEKRFSFWLFVWLIRPNKFSYIVNDDNNLELKHNYIYYTDMCYDFKFKNPLISMVYSKIFQRFRD